jgi:hypothetical protein
MYWIRTKEGWLRVNPPTDTPKQEVVERSPHDMRSLSYAGNDWKAKLGWLYAD